MNKLKRYEKKVEKNPYLINGIYKSDIDTFFNELSREELMIMIKRGFISCGGYNCLNVKEPFISYEQYISKENIKNYIYKWENIQCPLHSSQNNKCDKLKLLNKYNYPACEFLAHYLTGALIYSKVKY
ncbi:MAG TPA: hypothetical protein PLD27_06150 [bacterium]|nr:hypothetical protein [bacterium]HOL46859.1 hypothetical protein [bacterium]HPQ18792.1 hypothetical protein [bacterium]